jgi:hypothetical protein
MLNSYSKLSHIVAIEIEVISTMIFSFLELSCKQIPEPDISKLEITLPGKRSTSECFLALRTRLLEAFNVCMLEFSSSAELKSA